jgi:shikimate dehydrogenase
MGITGRTKVYGVIGDPIEHSLSPILQNAAFEHAKLDCKFLAFHVKPEGVEAAVKGMRALGIAGLNVTMPHKHAVMQFLDDVDNDAKLVGAVNTIVNAEGTLIGFSTDGLGALNALRTNGASPRGKRVVLLGAGGSARAIAFTLCQEVKELVVLNRTVCQAEELAKTIQEALDKKIVAKKLTVKAVQENLEKADILINATSVGMKPKADASLVKPEWLRKDLAIMDIVYNPLETKLAKDAKAAGAKVISGVEMLIHQGAASFQIWTGQQAPIEVMRQAALTQLEKTQ